MRLAQELAEALHLSEVRFIPSANPPHKAAPEVSAQRRAEMVGIAISDNSLFKLDARELQRNSDSYTIDTLISLRETLGENAALCLIMGSDAFINLATWHRWQELLNFCHIVLVQRPNKLPNQSALPKNLEALLHDNYTENIADLSQQNAGFIHMQQITALDISSTKIREMFKNGQTPRYLIPDKLIAYIKQHQLYK